MHGRFCDIAAVTDARAAGPLNAVLAHFCKLVSRKCLRCFMGLDGGFAHAAKMFRANPQPLSMERKAALPLYPRELCIHLTCDTQC